MTGCEVARCNLREKRFLHRTDVLSNGASGVKRTSRWQGGWVGDVSFEDNPLLVPGQIGIGHRGGREK